VSALCRTGVDVSDEQLRELRDVERERGAQLETVKALVEHGADVNIGTQDGCAQPPAPRDRR
jgi:hypothetical protein